MVVPFTGFVDTFGGNAIYPSQPSFLQVLLTSDIVLSWPIEIAAGGAAIVADIIEVSANADNLTISLSDARQTSTGYTSLFNNIGTHTFSVLDSTGTTLMTVASGEVWEIYLADNSTAAGTWRVFQYGAGVSSANAAALAGAGLVAITTTLNEEMEVQAEAADYVIINADRAKIIEWTGGTGNITLPAAGTVGANWFVITKNSGTGIVTVTPPSGTIDQTASLDFSPDESAFLVTDGTDYFTIGFGKQINSVFDFVSINVAGTGDFVLTGANLNRVSYRFTGVLTGNRNIIVPNTIQQYWVDNETSGAFSLTVKTVAGTGVGITQGNRAILYCDGINVVLAQTAGSITFSDGSAAAPGIAFTADSSTGIFRAAPHTLGFASDGLVRATVDQTGHWIFDIPDDNTAPAIIFTGIVGGRGVVAQTATSQTSATPALSVRSNAVNGFAFLSILGNNGTEGTTDLSLFQNGSTGDATILNRANANLKLGSNSIVGINIDDTGLVTFPVGASFGSSAIGLSDGLVTAPSIFFTDSVNWGFFHKVYSGSGTNAQQEVSFAHQGVDGSLIIGYDGSTSSYTIADNLGVAANAPTTDPFNTVRGIANTLYFGNQSAGAASAGGATLPANPLGFLVWVRGSTVIKIPYYAT